VTPDTGIAGQTSFSITEGGVYDQGTLEICGPNGCFDTDNFSGLTSFTPQVAGNYSAVLYFLPDDEALPLDESGIEATDEADFYAEAAPPPPVITAINPALGPAGQSVQVAIAGSGFGSSPSVAVLDAGGNAVPVTIGQCPQCGPTLISATFAIPSIAVGGRATVTVTAGSQPSNAAAFTVIPPSSPTSVVIAQSGITNLPLQAGLQNNFPAYLTGVGILATMLTEPAATLFNGSRFRALLPSSGRMACARRSRTPSSS